MTSIITQDSLDSTVPAIDSIDNLGLTRDRMDNTKPAKDSMNNAQGQKQTG
jgi:hypothetical protein